MSHGRKLRHREPQPLVQVRGGLGGLQDPPRLCGAGFPAPLTSLPCLRSTLCPAGPELIVYLQPKFPARRSHLPATAWALGTPRICTQEPRGCLASRHHSADTCTATAGSLRGRLGEGARGASCLSCGQARRPEAWPAEGPRAWQPCSGCFLLPRASRARPPHWKAPGPLSVWAWAPLPWRCPCGEGRPLLECTLPECIRVCGGGGWILRPLAVPLGLYHAASLDSRAPASLEWRVGLVKQKDRSLSRNPLSLWSTIPCLAPWRSEAEAGVPALQAPCSWP